MKIIFTLSSLWVFLVVGSMAASFAGDVPVYFWSAVAAAVIAAGSFRWLKRAG